MLELRELEEKSIWRWWGQDGRERCCVCQPSNANTSVVLMTVDVVFGKGTALFVEEKTAEGSMEEGVAELRLDAARGTRRGS